MQETNQKTPQRSLLVIVLAVLMCVTAVAWFALVNRSRSVDMEIEMPPVIYIRDDNLQ